jgi:hypothetical protein
MPTGDATWPVRLRSALAVTAVGALLLAGCSSEATPASSGPSSGSTSDSAGPSGSPSSSPSESPPAEPDPVKGTAGQRAFVTHVIDLWGFALRTNDVRPLSALGRGKPCGGCPALRRELAQRADQGWSVDFAGAQVHGIKLAGQGKVEVASATVDIPESDSFNTDGTFRNTNPAHSGATFTVQMRYTGKQYQLLAFSVS